MTETSISIYPDFFKICNDWTEFFYETEMESVIKKISEDLGDEKFYPEKDNIFKCFYLTPYKNVNVVLLGQDPYHNGSATGLCFDVKRGNIINPSLQNIYKELENEGYYPTKDGNLSHWGKQGVLLLNTALTVRPSEPESHLLIWSEFTKRVFEFLCKKDDIIWVLLGKKAADYKQLITNKNHTIIERTHPSPYSATKSSLTQSAFIESNLFKEINQSLVKYKKSTISW
jgi:uracil-DNA glycosylase